MSWSRLSDSGIGIPSEVLLRIFEPFFTTKEQGKGTGLGLSMVFGFAQQLGGAATIDSAPDQGTTISLYLPRTDLPPNRDHASASKAFGDEQLDVLLVDDDAAVRASAREMLAELGHAVTEEAVARQRLRRCKPVG